jgi:hypothetical protein
MAAFVRLTFQASTATAMAVASAEHLGHYALYSSLRDAKVGTNLVLEQLWVFLGVGSNFGVVTSSLRATLHML